MRRRAVGRLEVFTRGHPDFPAEDVPAAPALDRFTFALAGERERLDGFEYVRLRRAALDDS